MKRFRLALLALVLLTLAPAPVLEAATCYGRTPCNACKNCRYCKHCAENGGTCGVCKRRAASDHGAHQIP